MHKRLEHRDFDAFCTFGIGKKIKSTKFGFMGTKSGDHFYRYKLLSRNKMEEPFLMDLVDYFVG